MYCIAGHLPPHAGALLLLQLLEISLAENGNNPGNKQSYWGHIGEESMRYHKAPSHFGSTTSMTRADRGLFLPRHPQFNTT